MGQFESTTQQTAAIAHDVFLTAKSTAQGQQTCIATTILTDQEKYERWKERLSFAQLDSEYIFLPLTHSFTQKGVCGSEGELLLTFQYFPNMLKEEIQKRNFKKVAFQENDLWYLLYCVLDAQYEMWIKTNKFLDGVNPSSIFLSNSGNVKILSQISCPQRILRSQTMFFAPQQYNQSYLHGPETLLLAQIFSIGLTILCAAQIIDGDEFYGSGGRINEGILKGVINQWKQNERYSQVFTALIQSMVQFEPAYRIKPFQLWEWINNYEQFILEKEDFSISSLPPSIEELIIQRRNSLIRARNKNSRRDSKQNKWNETQRVNTSQNDASNYKFKNVESDLIANSLSAPSLMMKTFNPQSKQHYYVQSNNLQTIHSPNYLYANELAPKTIQKSYFIHPSSQNVVSSVFYEDQYPSLPH